MRLVILETPYRGDIKKHLDYLRLCLKDSLSKGEAPFASHGVYTTVLDDNDIHERYQGIEAGLAWATRADATVVYTDYGISEGMIHGINHATLCNRPVEYRRLYESA